MKLMHAIRLGAAALMAMLVSHAASAQPLTTDDLISRGTVNIGIIMDTPPYGFLDANQQPDGFDVKVAGLLAQYLGVKLNIVPLVGANRVPFLLTGKVDMVVASLGITPDRAKQVAFSSPYMLADVALYAPKDKTIKSVADLNGLNVAVTRGSTQQTVLQRETDGKATFSQFDENSGLVQALLNKQVDALAVAAAFGDAAFAANPDANIERKFTVFTQGNGVGLRKEDTELLQWVNAFVYYIKSDGELNDLYVKYWKTPMPANMPTF